MKHMKIRNPTNCPIVYSLDTFGDKWSLVILRDLLLGGKKHFREFLTSEEKIASNILSNRLELLIANGLITKHDDPRNKSAAIYMPTKKALDLVPMIVEMMRWGIIYNPNIDTSIAVIHQAETNPEGLRKDILEIFAEIGGVDKI